MKLMDKNQTINLYISYLFERFTSFFSCASNGCCFGR